MVRYDRETAERGAKYIDDRRGSGGGRRRVGGGGKAVGGIGGLILLVIAAVFGLDLTGGSGGFGGVDATSGFDGGTVATGTGTASNIDDDTEEFMAFLMFDIQETWDEYFSQSGELYQETTLVIFDGLKDCATTAQRCLDGECGNRPINNFRGGSNIDDAGGANNTEPSVITLLIDECRKLQLSVLSV